MQTEFFLISDFLKVKKERCKTLIEKFREILKKYKIEEQSLCHSATMDEGRSQLSNDLST